MSIYPIRAGINWCFLIGGTAGAVLVDSGPPNKGHLLINAIKATPIPLRDVKLVVLTHGDFDHSGGAATVREVTGAKIAIHEKDAPTIERARFNWPRGVTLWGRTSRSLIYPLLKRVMKLSPTTANIVLDSQDYPLTEIGVKGRIISTPGHTPGSISVLLDSGEAFVGCLAHSGFPFRRKPGLPIYAEDIESVIESWRILIARGAKTVYPAHGEPFSIDAMVKALSG